MCKLLKAQYLGGFDSSDSSANSLLNPKALMRNSGYNIYIRTSSILWRKVPCP